jgi:hypothetical protein
MAKERLDPNPSSLVHSFRSMGYTLETAVADLIDNSITASASEIQIYFKTNNASPVFVIIDNGNGMPASELKEAMRLGSTNPLEKRKDNDLGRFGLGMKTASFSICKRLTVVSMNDGEISGARWDLDEIATSNRWDIDILPQREIEQVPFFEHLSDNGTAIVWEKIDRMIDVSVKDVQSELEMAISALEKHLQLTFHRFIDGERGFRKVAILINGHQIESFDPFNIKNPATQILEEDEIMLGNSKISVVPYILPHHSKTKEDEYERHAGEGGYLANQGFYVYRNRRLIFHGSWFRLATPENLTKLARVRIDIPNDMDADWNIDVKKSIATPPTVIRERLKNTLEKIIGKSAKTYKARGKRIRDSRIIQMWEQQAAQGKVFYKINPEHPLVLRIREHLKSTEEAEFAALLDLIAKCFPTDLLFSDYGSKPNDVIQNEINKDALVDVAKMMISGWMSSDRISKDDALKKLSNIDPFNKYMDCINSSLGAKK